MTLSEYFIAGFEKTAFAWNNARFGKLADFMKGTKKLKALSPANATQSGTRYQGSHFSIRAQFKPGEVVKSVGMGKGSHYRVVGGSQKGTHFIKVKLPGGKIKVYAHRDAYAPSLTKPVETAKHMVTEGMPAAATKLEQRIKKKKGRIRSAIGTGIGRAGRIIGSTVKDITNRNMATA